MRRSRDSRRLRVYSLAQLQGRGFQEEVGEDALLMKRDLEEGTTHAASEIFCHGCLRCRIADSSLEAVSREVYIFPQQQRPFRRFCICLLVR